MTRVTLDSTPLDSISFDSALDSTVAVLIVLVQLNLSARSGSDFNM
jgi:hypothetical protein